MSNSVYLPILIWQRKTTGAFPRDCASWPARLRASLDFWVNQIFFPALPRALNPSVIIAFALSTVVPCQTVMTFLNSVFQPTLIKLRIHLGSTPWRIANSSNVRVGVLCSLFLKLFRQPNEVFILKSSLVAICLFPIFSLFRQCKTPPHDKYQTFPVNGGNRQVEQNTGFVPSTTVDKIGFQFVEPAATT